MPHLNGVPINQLPGMDRLAPDVIEAIGKGPVGRTIFVRNLVGCERRFFTLSPVVGAGYMLV